MPKKTKKLDRELVKNKPTNRLKRKVMATLGRDPEGTVALLAWANKVRLQKGAASEIKNVNDIKAILQQITDMPPALDKMLAAYASAAGKHNG